MKRHLVIFGLLVLSAGCGKPAEGGLAPSAPAEPDYPFRLELVKIEPNTLTAQFGGETTPISSTWYITLKPVRQGTGDPPPAANDMWIRCVFLTGSPAEAKVEEFISVHPPGKRPVQGTMSIEKGTDRKMEFRFGQKDFSSKELELVFGTGPFDRVGYSLLIAPKEKWDGRSASEITLPVRNGYDNLADILTKKAKPIEHNAVAVLVLCGYGPDKDGAEPTLLSQPLRATLEPGADKK